MDKEELKWKKYCKSNGFAYLELYKCKSRYADLPQALREYVYLKECDEAFPK